MAKKKSPTIGILSMQVSDDKNRIYAKGDCIIKFLGGKGPVDTEKITIDVPVCENAATIKFAEKFGKALPGGFRKNSFELIIDKSLARTFDIQNKLIVNYDNKYFGRFLYSLKDLKTGKNKNSKVFIDEGIAIFFRQSKYNSLVLTVRDENQYDYAEGQERLRIAAEKAKELSNKDIILMYEKNCSRYEESASVLYEKLIDAGYQNVYYVANFDNPSIKNLEEKYKKNLIEKDSDKHLQYFFASDKFISTESTEHALQLRIASKLVMDKVKNKDLKYVFLQHGVMYMVSLNSELRTAFRNNDLKMQRTVVSSEAEANHFIKLGGMKKENLYITGLAKFDKSYKRDDADKIVIMPTWRRWENNQARISITSTRYYKMIERMFDAVPEKLREKVIILPHPLMAERFKKGTKLTEYIVFADSYDEILRDCDTLITDYSSIAYDAFYRGSKVLFFWEEKDECMQHYGEGTHLMINEDNIFGQICMNNSELRQALEKTYLTEQDEKYIDKYQKIVEFHDGKNSERIIERLKKDKII